jgi:hypothetical protein
LGEAGAQAPLSGLKKPSSQYLNPDLSDSMIGMIYPLPNNQKLFKEPKPFQL